MVIVMTDAAADDDADVVVRGVAKATGQYASELEDVESR